MELPEKDKGLFWWFGLILSMLLVLLTLVTIALVGMVYRTMNQSGKEKIDFEAINRANRDGVVDTLKPRSALGPTHESNYVFVPEEHEKRVRERSYGSGYGNDGDLNPYIPAPMDLSAEGLERRDPAGYKEEDDDLFMGGAGQGAWDPNGELEPIDALF